MNYTRSSKIFISVYELFEEQVQKYPDTVAFVFGKLTLTYEELNKRVNRLAHYLIQNCRTKDEELLVLFLNRDEQMIISILAAIKAGMAYVPVDPSYPLDRISYIIKDTDSRNVLTQSTNSHILEQALGRIDMETPAPRIISMDDQSFQGQLSLFPPNNPNCVVYPNSLAYVIYTSGTTGTPKGVLIEHKGISNLVNNQIQIFNLSRESKAPQNCLWFANYVFDAHVWDIFAPLCSGNSLHLVENEVRSNLLALSEYISNSEITLATVPPALLDTKTLLPLRYLVVAGEKTGQNILEFYQKNHVSVINAYGPTEITVCSHFHRFQGGNGNVIGYPIDQIRHYVLDDQFQLAQKNSTGELYIGGVGVARGYLGRSELTLEKFIKNPFNLESDPYQNILYKTGDFVRLLDDGSLEYIERKDEQVKINGNRIELGEIETSLSLYPGIEQSVVQVLEVGEHGTKTLLAYYSAVQRIDEGQLRFHLEGLLPSYMIPSGFHYMEKFELTINGKIDKKALPIVQIKPEKGIQPRNSIESKICSIFARHLSVEPSQINLSTDLVQMGGNSLIAGKIAADLNEDFDGKLQISEIMKHRKVGMIYDLLLLTKEKYSPLIQLNWTENSSKMFMVHDGVGGSELYTTLADRLKSEFSCYGIDHYNLYNSNKIDDLDVLSRMYIREILPIIGINREEPIYFFGVCMGGLIATNIACILEESGYSQIKVIVWDSVIADEILIKIRNETKINDVKSAIAKVYAGVAPSFIHKIQSSIEANRKLMNSELKRRANHTDFVLFKTPVADVTFPILATEYEYMKTLAENNLNLVQEDAGKIHKIEVHGAKHSDYLKNVDLVSREILLLKGSAIEANT